MAMPQSALTYEELMNLNPMWTEAEEPEIGAHVPEGDYIARIEACRPERSATQKKMLRWELVIADDSGYAGQIVRRNNMLETPQNLGWLKADLRKIGVDIDAPSFDLAKFLGKQLGSIIGLLVKISVKKGKPSADGRDNWNVYFQGLYEGNVDGTAPAAVPDDSGEYDPWREE